MCIGAFTSRYCSLLCRQKHWRVLPPRFAGLTGIPSNHFFEVSDKIRKSGAKKYAFQVESAKARSLTENHNDAKESGHDTLGDGQCSLQVRIPNRAAGTYRVEATVQVNDGYEGFVAAAFVQSRRGIVFTVMRNMLL